MAATYDVTELDALLEELGKRGFLWHGFRVDRHGPEVIAFTFQWDHCADVVIVFDEQHATAYRMPTGRDTDVFAPQQVYWLYEGSPVWTIRALLTLPPPGNPPGRLIDAPRGLGLPVDGRMPVRMRRRGH